MATCPSCGANSREDPQALIVEKVLVAKPIGSFSVAGAQMKVSAVERFQLRCTRCEWSVFGHLETDRYFVADSAPSEAESTSAHERMGMAEHEDRQGC